MKILFWQWYSFMNRGIETAFQKLDVEYDILFYQQTDWEKNDGIVETLEQKLATQAYDLVFSVNFAPLVAEVCKQHGILYVSWVYDAPLHIRNLEALKYDTNRIFFFDSIQAQEYQKQGIHAFHMPLAADLQFAEGLTERVREKGADIAMVGQLYQTEYKNYTAILPERVRGYLDGLLNAQMKVSGGYFLGELIDLPLLEQCNEAFQKASDGTFQIGKRELEYMMACEMTGRERYLAMALLSKYFKVELYSGDRDERLSQVQQMGYVNYYHGMAEVFAGSRINLNISLKIIPSGVPLRIFDILGAGGFVLTNLQPELYELFTPDKDLVIYEGLEDLYEKAAFYIAHDAERKKIAEQGHRTAAERHTFVQRIREMLRMCTE